MPHIRVAVDGVVIHQNAILLVEYQDDRLGRHFGLPGGGVEPDELLHAAVQREVLEETGVSVRVGPLLLVHEYHPSHHSGNHSEEHELRLVFQCTAKADKFVEPTVPDPEQIGVHWLPLAMLPEIALDPRIGPLLRQLLAAPLDDLFHSGTE
ncbi:MAG: NUDIX domain-containing protein [Caldilineaceae bacterium]